MHVVSLHPTWSNTINRYLRRGRIRTVDCVEGFSPSQIVMCWPRCVTMSHYFSLSPHFSALLKSSINASTILNISSAILFPSSLHSSAHNRPNRSGCHLILSCLNHSYSYSPLARNMTSTSCRHALMLRGSDLRRSQEGSAQIVIARGR